MPMQITNATWVDDGRPWLAEHRRYIRVGFEDGSEHFVPDDMANADRQALQAWIDKGNEIAEPRKPTPAAEPSPAEE
jgi:hypothetical protein